MNNSKQIYILSVKGSNRRSSFKDFPMPYTFFDAIPLDCLDMFDDVSASHKYKRIIRDQEKSCTISHISIAKKFMMKNHDWLITLEDDAVIVGDFLKLLASLEKTEFTNPVALVIGHSKTVPKFRFIQKLKQPLYNDFFIGDFRFGRKKTNYVGTVSYILNRQAAKILSEVKRPYWVADDWLEIEKLGISIFHIEENIFYEIFDEISSTGNKIHIRHNFYRYPFKNIAAILLNRLRFIASNISRSLG